MEAVRAPSKRVEWWGNDQSGSGTVISSDRWPSAEIEGRIMRKLYRCVYLWRMMEQVRLERPRTPGGGQFKTPQGGSEWVVKGSGVKGGVRKGVEGYKCSLTQGLGEWE